MSRAWWGQLVYLPVGCQLEWLEGQELGTSGRAPGPHLALGARKAGTAGKTPGAGTAGALWASLGALCQGGGLA